MACIHVLLVLTVFNVYYELGANMIKLFTSFWLIFELATSIDIYVNYSCPSSELTCIFGRWCPAAPACQWVDMTLLSEGWNHQDFVKKVAFPPSLCFVVDYLMQLPEIEIKLMLSWHRDQTFSALHVNAWCWLSFGQNSLHDPPDRRLRPFSGHLESVLPRLRHHDQGKSGCSVWELYADLVKLNEKHYAESLLTSPSWMTRISMPSLTAVSLSGWLR